MYTVITDDYGKQTEILRRFGFKLIDYDDLVNYKADEINLPAKAVNITFDDGLLL